MSRSTTKPETLLISTERQGTMLVLALAGDLDHTTVAGLNQELQKAEAAGKGDVAIDLQAVEYIDGTGLHALIQIHDRCDENGCRLTLRRPSRYVRRVLQLTSMFDMFSVD